MALFSGSSGGGRRPRGPRPFSGRERSAHAPPLRPHGDPRRATAAPFQAIPEYHAPHATVSTATPGELPITDANESLPVAELAAPQQPVASTEMPTLAPSVLRVDDIRSEPFGWDSPFPESEPEADAHVASSEGPEAFAEPDIDAVIDAHEAALPIDEPVADVIRAEATEVVVDSSQDSPGDVGYAAPGFLADDETILHDAAALDAPGVHASHHSSPVDDWLANEVMHAGSDPEASAWTHEDAACLEVPVNSPWTDLAETLEAPTLETEAIEAPEHEEPQVDAVMARESDVAGDAAEPGAMLVSDADVTDVVSEPGAFASEVVATANRVPDESWWGPQAESMSHVEPQADAASTPLALARQTPPVDGLAALEALVHETQGAERAVEALEAVARMIRSREIVVSVGAGATAESVLASILASLLSHPS